MAGCVRKEEQEQELGQAKNRNRNRNRKKEQEQEQDLGPAKQLPAFSPTWPQEGRQGFGIGSTHARRPHLPALARLHQIATGPAMWGRAEVAEVGFVHT